MNLMIDELKDKILARFQVIDIERMRDLPIYNPALIVETINLSDQSCCSDKRAH